MMEQAQSMTDCVSLVRRPSCNSFHYHTQNCIYETSPHLHIVHIFHIHIHNAQNPLVVFTSNMFAIMGLRSLYTILSKAASDLEYLEPAVAVVLGFVGGKLIGEYFGYQVPTVASLGVVITMLSGGVGASLYKKRLVGEEA
jgi:predicted tellurium resistance membrane protein TerC